VSASSAPQVTFEDVSRDLASADAAARLRAVRLLKDAGYPEAAVPIATLVTDPQDDVQLEAISAEVNIFLAERVVARKRLGFVIEVRNQVLAEAAFAAGPLALGPRPVPSEVLTALRAGAHDGNPRVGLESLYAFGVLAAEPGGARRRDLLSASGADLAAFVGAPDPAVRYAGVRVIGRVYAHRPSDAAVDSAVGDAVIVALNDRDRAVKVAAMEALGAMRYDRAVQALDDLFRYYGKGDLAAAALDAVARIAHPGSAPLLAAELASKSTPIRVIAAEGLVRIGDRAQMTAIEAALGTGSDDGASLAKDFAAALLSGASIDPIVSALLKPRLRDQARAYLVDLVGTRLSAFPVHAQDPDAAVRRDLADVLGLADDPAALPLAESLLADRDQQVASAAERAVARLRATTM
jgi:HEAT repeat protein